MSMLGRVSFVCGMAYKTRVGRGWVSQRLGQQVACADGLEDTGAWVRMGKLEAQVARTDGLAGDPVGAVDGAKRR